MSRLSAICTRMKITLIGGFSSHLTSLFFLIWTHPIPNYRKTPRSSSRGLSFCLSRRYYFISSNSFLFIFTKLKIFDSTPGEISLLPWFGTGNVVLPFEKITWDHFCLTISNHNFFSLLCISINLYGIFYLLIKQMFLYLLL